jgi:hypothetical protein
MESIVLKIDCESWNCGGCEWVYEDSRKDPILGKVSTDRCRLFGQRLGSPIAKRCQKCLDASLHTMSDSIELGDSRGGEE